MCFLLMVIAVVIGIIIFEIGAAFLDGGEGEL